MPSQNMDSKSNVEEVNREWQERMKKDAAKYINDYTKQWDDASKHFEEFNEKADKKIITESERLAHDERDGKETIAAISALLTEVDESGILTEQTSLVNASSNKQGMACKMYREMAAKHTA